MVFKMNDIPKKLKNIDSCSLKCLINRAYVMFKKSEAGVDKEIIAGLFRKTNDKYREDIKLRLAAINTLYNTNITRNKDGLKDLTCRIHDASKGESDIKNRFLNFFNKHCEKKCNANEEFCKTRTGRCNGDKTICEIIHGKCGNRNAKATSLATKYAYFLTKQEFPIHDSLVQKICWALSQNQPVSLDEIKKRSVETDPPNNFFEVLHIVSQKIGKNGVDKFDAFCWTWGKIAIDRKEANNIFGKGRVDNFVLKLREARLLTK